MAAVLTGLDRVAAGGLRLPGRGRAAVLCNNNTVSSEWIPTLYALRRIPGLEIVRILSPQHGFASEKQDNMIESADAKHPDLGVPITSLYSHRRSPDPELFEDTDVVLIDLQDVGTRVYTFVSTAFLTIQGAYSAGVPVIVLDRPNPIGGACEGPVLEEALTSFVGMLDVPLRHGLTMGELCLYGAGRSKLIDEAAATGIAERALDDSVLQDTDSSYLRIVGATGWSRRLMHGMSELPWVPPSPNMPSLETALVYPGQVALEGTNLSEGRGTTRPFETFGAPFLRPPAVLETLVEIGAVKPPGGTPHGTVHGCRDGALAGALLREITFEPTFQKFAGETVHGFQLHVLEPERFHPVHAVVALLWAVRRAHPENFRWCQPPYEYETVRLPIDLIFGTDKTRKAIDDGTHPDKIASGWASGIVAFKERVRSAIVYRDTPREVRR
ncbi:exo-beta-N-acetylmuramidase NamZ domain-containing protein [Candidatus Eisenbacteria bacterium]|uniref:Exo-beta-N-acetylmuramidase NamZ domain-containing protein n=1 Tax=Eiseniibacteriota bacterium TaxID=2212470 RepID=A0ABV6YI48_UNCEI